ncbi:LOW QUALITY PROTEIN: putative cytochrome P450 cyp-13B1 [Galendromus occidentalis]|uniref:LOW QUALITY PROTEIN: putative cytochrome P450 cyp-13B1 n=1 Tax=Galendromus occidentalis TaxID=34638 RepID=A0AAJ7SGD5_9ACAR|nr:LOW QUALITY PROTEIN: putative cytochrome P450 cyp-13B1 [Galendromus occidentalis]
MARNQATIVNGVAAATFSLDVDALDDPDNVFVKHCTGIFKGSLAVLEQRRKQNRKPGESDELDSWLERANPQFTDDMLISQMFAFFIAGLETSSYTLMFTTYLLATHPRKQEEIFKDNIEIITDPENVTFEDYHKLTLAEAAIWETLRSGGFVGQRCSHSDSEELCQPRSGAFPGTDAVQAWKILGRE